jgi:hypothetical protein
MKQNSRKERFESVLSQKRHNVAIRISKTALQLLLASCRCCLHGNWKAATTNFTTSMNMILTGIVNPKAGANRKN